MPADERDVLEVLKCEREFISAGQYVRSGQTPCVRGSLFQDSPTCLNFGDPKRGRPCDECLLTALVPQDRLAEEVPCHHIPLNPEGETIHTLEQKETREAMEQKVKTWLCSVIKILEDARGQRVTPRAPAPPSILP